MAVAALGLLAGCGGPGAPLGPPSAKDILSKPLHTNLNDAHFVVSGKFVSSTPGGVAVDVHGDGALVYKNLGAGRFKFETTVAGQKVSYQDISVGGVDYTFVVPGNGKWTAKMTTSGLGRDSFTGASDFAYVGEENLPAGNPGTREPRTRTATSLTAGFANATATRSSTRSPSRATR